LSVQWAWPDASSYELRHGSMLDFARRLCAAWTRWGSPGHPLEVGWDFLEERLPEELSVLNSSLKGTGPMPWLAALIVCSAFDIALHDAYGNLLEMPVYQTYGPDHLNRDLSCFLEPDTTRADFHGKYPANYLLAERRDRLPAWHLVGGLDPLTPSERSGLEPNDGYPADLEGWIERDGLICLKVKLRGNDFEWDLERLLEVGRIALSREILWMTADFNCTVLDPAYVIEILDRLMDRAPRIWQMILYVEQPFPYDLERYQIDVRELAARKLLFMDESAHDWRLIRLGRNLGWTGVALKTCKTQTGALLSACWAREHGLSLMVQDLTNPRLAQIPHCLLAGHVGTIMGVETNAMQFYPEASGAEAAVHPGLYTRKDGCVDLTTIRGSGFGYRLPEISTQLPVPARVSSK